MFDHCRVDEKMRLPNSDICPGKYSPHQWRKLNAIQSRTFKLLDLKSLCNAMGKALNIVGPVRDLRVSQFKIVWKYIF